MLHRKQLRFVPGKLNKSKKSARPPKARANQRRSAAPDAETLRRILYTMKLAREAEYRIDHVLYRQGKIVGGVYVGRGQEAIGSSSATQLKPGDVALPSHRDFPSYLLRGFSLKDMFLNILGRAHGPTRGRDNMHHVGKFDRRDVIPLISHLGDTLPVACGVALALKQRKETGIALVYFGEGTTSRGDVHEAMNFASVLRLPVVFICNNNSYAYSTPTEKQYRIKDLSLRAVGYDMPGASVDGNDVAAVYAAVAQAIARARADDGPSFVVCNTFRMSGHSAHDAADYVPPKLFKRWEKLDPIPRLEKVLLTKKLLTRPGLQEMERRIKIEVDESVSFAEASPLPPPESATEGVYCSDRIDDCWGRNPL